MNTKHYVLEILMPKISRLILASKSQSRAKLLRNAGVIFSQLDSKVDETTVKETFLKSGELADLAMILAQTKALTVSEQSRDSYVIGADQTLLFENKLYDKPSSLQEAQDQLLTLRAKQHKLETAVSVVKNQETLWSYSETSYLTMRNFSPAFLGKYLAAVGDDVKTSVGGYKLEGFGLQLFEKIEGDFFSILGLPMLELLKFLRSENLLED